MSSRPKKRPKVVPEPAVTPRPEKRAVSSPPGPDRQLRFRFGRLDHGGKWALSKIDKKDHQRLLKRLGHFEEMTVAGAKSRNLLAQYDMTDCPNKAAKSRLSNQYDGLDSITRLTIEPSGSLRLHGILEEHEFYIVWWDPKHEIWPENKQVR